jgi:exonuclease SbcC
MKITKISLRNLNSLRGTFTLDFDTKPLQDAGIFAITGDTGAGKTTLLDAMTLALYGKIHRNKENAEVMSFGTTECMAEVEFENGNQRYRSKWAVHRAGNKLDGNLQAPQREVSKFNPSNEQYEILNRGKREADEIILKVTGLDYHRFCRSVLLAQGNFAAFLHAEEKERSELLERMTGTEIYSELSQAAHNKKREEAGKVDNIEGQLNNLEVKSPEALKELELELANLRAQIEPVRENLHRHTEMLTWRKNLDKQQKLLADLELEKTEHVKKTKAEEENFQKLEAHYRASRHNPRLIELRNFQTKRNESRVKQEKLTEDLKTQRKKLEETKVLLDHKKLELENLNRDLSVLKPLYDQCIALDSRIQNQRNNLQLGQVESAKAARDLDENLSSLAFHKNQHEESTKKIQSLKNWQIDNSKDHKIQGKLDEIKEKFNLYKPKNESIKSNKKLLSEIEKTLQTKQEEYSAAETEFSECNLQIQTLSSEIFEVGAVNGKSEISAWITRSNNTLNDLRLRQANLQRLNDFLKRKKDFEAQLETKQETLNAYLEFLKNTYASIKSIKESVVEAQNLEENKRKLYNQQVQIANYEVHRGTLKEGEACPLCFSTHHPFRDLNLEHYVDLTHKEMEEAISRHAELREKLQFHQQEENRLKQAIAQIAGTEPDRSGGELVGLKLQLQNLQNEMDGILLKEQLDPNILRLEDVNSIITSLRGEIDASEQVFEQVMKLNTERENQINTLEVIRAKKDKIYTEQNALQQQLFEIRTNLKAEENELNRLVESLNTLLTEYGYGFQPVNFDDVYKKLEDRAKNWQKASEELQAQQKLNTQSEAQIIAINKALENLRTTVSNKVNHCKDLQIDLEKLEIARKEIPLGPNPKLDLDKAEQNLRQAQEASNEITNQKIRIETDCHHLADQLHLTTEQLNREEGAIAKLSAELEMAARQSGFPDLAALMQAIMDEESVQKVENTKSALLKDGNKIEGAIQSTLSQVEQLTAQALSEKTAEELEGDERAIQSNFNILNQNLGATETTLNVEYQRAQNAAVLLDRLNAQKLEYQRWKLLDDLIGSADGTKFRVFAQGLTLQQLTLLANKHLEQLSGRYKLQRRSFDNLELEIMDTFQADNCRSVKTLSGGESFLVSLALALGLSDLAGRNTTIRSLFIDEGFGTLDENSLDLALNTLENLQGAGKTIGIISHVKELKERIGVQVLVRKGGNGFSSVETRP